LKFNNSNYDYKKYDKKKKNAMSGSEELVSFSSLFNYFTYRELSNMSKEIDVKQLNHEIDRYLNKALEHKNFEPEMYKGYIVDLLWESVEKKTIDQVADAIFSYSSEQDFIPYRIFESCANEIQNEIDELCYEEQYEHIEYKDVVVIWLEQQ